MQDFPFHILKRASSFCKKQILKFTFIGFRKLVAKVLEKWQIALNECQIQRQVNYVFQP